jgi:hypothetical protein
MAFNLNKEDIVHYLTQAFFNPVVMLELKFQQLPQISICCAFLQLCFV